MGVWGQKGTRNSSTLLNRFLPETISRWPGKNIEEVILEHLQNSKEMNNSLDNMLKVLEADEYYRKAFKKVFKTKVTSESLSKAIASFVRTLVSGDSPYDRFMTGDKEALSEAARRGLILFQSERLNCKACHAGPNFTDENYNNNGAGQTYQNRIWEDIMLLRMIWIRENLKLLLCVTLPVPHLTCIMAV